MSYPETNRFFGRKIKLALLKKRLLDFKEGYRQNIAFISSRFLGKTTLLHKFLKELEDNDIIEIYVDYDHVDFDYFCNKFIKCILYNFSQKAKLPLSDDLSVLMEGVQGTIPQTVKAVKKIQSLVSHGKRLEAYREIIDLPQSFANESKKFCVLVFDEFHHLENLMIPDVFKELGKKIMTQNRCLYIVSSSSPGLAQRILSEKLSLLFGCFEIIEMGPFDIKTSLEFIEYNTPDLRMGMHLKNFLIDFTGGHPLYLKLICQELMHLASVFKQDEIFIPLLLKAIENVLFSSWGVLNRHFEILVQQLTTGKNNFIFAKILVSLSEGKKKVREVVGSIGLKQNLVSPKLVRLLDTDMVAKNGHCFYIEDKLFKYWVKFVFKVRRFSVGFDQEEQRVLFEKEITQALDYFNKVSAKDFSTRIIELLSCFEEEALNINGRKYKLPYFQEITPAGIPKTCADQYDLLKAETSSGSYMVVLKNGIIGENDINMILDETKKSSERLKKCILISPLSLDENARVKALQERMWIWNEMEIKKLLNFYEKPYIV